LTETQIISLRDGLLKLNELICFGLLKLPELESPPEYRRVFFISGVLGTFLRWF